MELDGWNVLEKKLKSKSFAFSRFCDCRWAPTNKIGFENRFISKKLCSIVLDEETHKFTWKIAKLGNGNLIISKRFEISAFWECPNFLF